VLILCMGMGSVNISIKKEAYNFLASLKERNRSFSDVILEFKEKESARGSAKRLLKFAGVLKDLDWDKKERLMRKFRESFNKRLSGK